MCFGGSSGSTPVYTAQTPTVISPPSTTVELDDSDIDSSTETDSTQTTGRTTLRNDLTTQNMGNPLAGRGINILG